MKSTAAKAIAVPKRFVSGLMDPWRGLGFLVRNPPLWPLAVLPFIIGIVIYAGSIWAGWHLMSAWLTEAFFDENTAWKAVGYLLAILFWILILLAAALLFIPISSLIANPFNDLLSEKTERIYRGVEVNAPFTLASLLRSLRTGLSGEIRRFITVSLMLVGALALNLIPVIGQILYTAASSLITINFLSLEYTSFSMDRRLYQWDQKKQFLRDHRARAWGFGAMGMLILMVPVINAFFIPVSAVAGTLLFCDTELEEAATTAPPPISKTSRN